MKMAEIAPKWLENTVGKGEIACYEQFLLFPVFSKDLYCRQVKTRACLGKGLSKDHNSATIDLLLEFIHTYLHKDLHSFK